MVAASTATSSSRSSPPGPGGGYEFVDEIKGGVIPREYIPAVDAGIQEAMEGGVLAGYPLVDVRARLTFGSYHDVDSSEMAFKIAGSMAFKEAARQAKPQLLEPVAAVEVVTAEEYMGDVIGDLSSRRGKIGGMEQRGNAQVINATVPIAEMFGYATRPSFAHPGPRDLHDAVRLLPSRCRSRLRRRSSPASAASNRHPFPVHPFTLSEGAEVIPWPRRSSSGTSRT